MRTAIVLLLTCVGSLAQGMGYVSMMTWEPRNLQTKVGLVASYDPGNTNTLILNGAGVSAMSNRVGSTFTLTNGVAANQPYLTNTLGGRPTLYFDGSTHFLKTPSGTLNQPEEIFILENQVSWTSRDAIFDGAVLFTGAAYQRTATPSLGIRADPPAKVFNNGTATIGAWQLLRVGFAGASTYTQINNLSVVSGDAGTSSMGGFTLGNLGDASGAGNIIVGRVLICNKTNAPAEANFLRWGMMKQASLW